jgi:hypothetical protein
MPSPTPDFKVIAILVLPKHHNKFDRIFVMAVCDETSWSHSRLV